jgi:hypothetical protein
MNQITKEEAYDIHIILTDPNAMLNLNLSPSKIVALDSKIYLQFQDLIRSDQDQVC